MPRKNASKPKQGRRGRLTSADKLKLAQRTEKCFPEGVPAQACQWSHTRPVWRLEDGRAVLIAYEIYRGPKNLYGKIPGVLGRSEFGMEIVVEVAYFVYVIGLSFDKVCLTLQFLQHLKLGKTQADTLLKQLSRHWHNEFEVLCPEYRQFTDRMLEIYRQACRLQRDGRFSPTGRANQVLTLDDAIYDLCLPQWHPELGPLPAGPANDYRLLVNEVMRLMLEEQLFTFVTTEPAVQPNGHSQPVSGTNNEAERTLRGPAEARKTGRTNKTIVGARRQTIIVSVLESLRLYLPQFTLTSVLAEIEDWWQAGQSCFTKLLKKMGLPQRPATILDQALPISDG